MEIVSENEVINAFNLLVPYLRELFDNEVSVAVTDTEKFLINVRADGKSYSGTAIPAKGGIAKAISEGRNVISYIPKEMFGDAMKSYSLPIKGKSGKVEGCICIGKSLKKREDLLELLRELSAAISEIMGISGEFSEKLNSVVEMNRETAKKIEEAQSNANSTDKIFNFIHQVSSQTDLLGINAAIEAARSESVGKGFNVIAQEIRQLSETSRESVDKISMMLSTINKSIDDICNSTQKTQGITETFTTAFSEITESVEKLNASAKILEAMADKV